MQEVLFSYIQFLILQISGHALVFLLVLLGVPVFWLVMKLTNLLYEEKALSLGALTFGLCSVISVVLFITNSSPAEYYKPLLFLLAGIMSFLCVSPIFSEAQPFEINARKKYFSIDSNTFPVAVVNQVNVKRCFNRFSIFMSNVFDIRFLPGKYGLIPIGFQFPATKFCRVYCDSLYFFRL